MLQIFSLYLHSFNISMPLKTYDLKSKRNFSLSCFNILLLYSLILCCSTQSTMLFIVITAIDTENIYKKKSFGWMRNFHLKFIIVHCHVINLVLMFERENERKIKLGWFSNQLTIQCVLLLMRLI